MVPIARGTTAPSIGNLSNGFALATINENDDDDDDGVVVYDDDDE